MAEVGRAEVALVFSGAAVVVNGHQVVYSVMTSSMVTVAVETKAGETDSEHTFSSQEVMVTKVVEFWVTVVVLEAEATAATAATVATVENCIWNMCKRVTGEM